MKLTQTIGAISLLGFAALSAVAAPEAPRRGGGPVAAACQQDMKTLCQGVKPGEGRIAACLREHHDQVSDGCKAALKEAQRQHPPKRGASQPAGQ